MKIIYFSREYRLTLHSGHIDVDIIGYYSKWTGSESWSDINIILWFSSWVCFTTKGKTKLKKVAQKNRRLVLTIAVKTTIWPMVLWYVWFTTKATLLSDSFVRHSLKLKLHNHIFICSRIYLLIYDTPIYTFIYKHVCNCVLQPW